MVDFAFLLLTHALFLYPLIFFVYSNFISFYCFLTFLFYWFYVFLLIFPSNHTKFSFLMSNSFSLLMFPFHPSHQSFIFNVQFIFLYLCFHHIPKFSFSCQFIVYFFFYKSFCDNTLLH